MRVPTNLITGFLGAGKTTAIRSLLERRPAGARWSVFINEYGMVSIDQALVEGDGDVEVQELAGGCFCCTTSAPLGPMLAQFIRQTRPERLIIEPSGAGHPARVIDTLRGERFRELIDLRATICLVDPKDFDNPRVVNRAVFHDQIEMADVVVLNWLDKRPAELVARCRDWIESFDPPKILVAETQFGAFDPRWLDLDAVVLRQPRLVDVEHAAAGKAADAAAKAFAEDPDIGSAVPPPSPTSSSRFVPIAESTGRMGIERGTPDSVAASGPSPGVPRRFPNQGLGQWACGWVFSPLDVFDRDALLDLLDTLSAARRIKGIFHCDDDWWRINQVHRDVSLAPSAYRHDSRLEIISESALDWLEIERQLIGCLRGNS